MRFKLTAADWENGTFLQVVVPIMIALLTFSSLGWQKAAPRTKQVATTALSRKSGVLAKTLPKGSKAVTSITRQPAQAEPKPVPKKKKEVVGWLPGWDQAEGLKTFASNPDAVSQVSPFWYGFNDRGTLTGLAGAENESVKTVARRTGRPLLPTITNNFDGAKTSAVLNDPARRSAHLSNILRLLDSGGYSGVDIDYEAMGASDRGAFSRFVADLGAAVHRRGKILSVTVLPKTSEPGTWSGPQSLDYAAIGKSADQVRIMAYDLSYPGGPPGPIAPANWVKQVLDFAVSRVPREKIYLGIPSYGYDWAGPGRGKPVMLGQALKLAAAKKAPLQWDAAAASPSFRYNDGGVGHTVWLENEQSLAAKIDLTRRYDIAGIAIWRLGRQPDTTWRVIRERLR